MENNTLKEYYVKLNEAWNNALNILGAINQSLSSVGTDVSVTVDNVTYRIPSFLYLENKLETLANNYDSISNIKDTGEAWITIPENSDTFKIQMVRTGTSPVSPIIDTSNIYASLTTNNFLKDLVSPKTFLKVNISNLPEQIEKVVMKKIIFNDVTFFDAMKARNPRNYDDFAVALYSLRKGVDFDEYESVLDLPIKRNKFKSQFKILYVDAEKTYIDEITGNNKNRTFTITVDTLKYTDQEDPSIEFGLKPGDKLALGNTSTIFKVKSIENTSNKITIEEYIGHYSLQNYDEDRSMVLGIYYNDFSDYHYLQVPLEENPYICIMLSTLQNNVRSVMSAPLFVNLNEVYMTDANGQYIFDEYGNNMNYMQYYQKNCINIGDIIAGLTTTSYPQLTSLTPYDIDNLQDNEHIKTLVSDTVDPNVILKVLPINEHIINNDTAEKIISMHTQKNELSTKINNLNDSISAVNDKLSTTDFAQDTSVSQTSLKAELNEYYSEKTVLQKQLISLVENINMSSAAIDGKELKYRIRGITDVKNLESYLKSSISEKIDLIGIDVEYKYKSINKEITKINTINNNVFTDWNKYVSIDKERIVKVSDNGSYFIEFENYSNTNNIIKWNQIDIPIVADEDVVIRIRYKYNIGQPFINLYTPWSEEITVVFPVEYKENVDITAVLSENQNDVITAKFNKTLITEGYSEHINNGIIDGSKTYFHDANNIYSGFSTTENNLMSIKDKFDEMQASIAKYQTLLESELTQKYKVYLNYDDKSIELLPNVENSISIFNADHITESFVKKNLSIVIKNTGEVPVKLYSIFPGGVTTPLIMSNDSFYEKNIINYERVPLTVDGLPHYQMLGQWIYFRENNPWTGQAIYYNSSSQNRYDWLATNANGCVWNTTETYQLMKRDFSQVMFGWRRRQTGADTYFVNTWKGLYYSKGTNSFNVLEDIENSLDIESIDERYQGISQDFFMYDNINNNYLTKYEDIYYDDNGTRYYLDFESSIFEFVSQHNVGGNFNDDSDFTGAFLYPDLPAITNILTNGQVGGYVEVPVGGALTVPVSLEFFLNENLTSVKKGLNFDIKPSSFMDPSHYLININCLYDYTATGNVMNSVSLNDESIDY